MRESACTASREAICSFYKEEKSTTSNTATVPYPYLVAMGLSSGEALLAAELVRDTSINNKGYGWDKIFCLMREQFGFPDKSEDLIRCHVACAMKGPNTYGTLAELVITDAFQKYEACAPIDPFAQYSLIGVLIAGCCLQGNFGCTVGNGFETRLAEFMKATAIPRSRTPAWSEEVLPLMSSAMKRYFRWRDTNGSTAFSDQISEMLSTLLEGGTQWIPPIDSGIANGSLLGPGAEMLKAFLYGVLDIKHRGLGRILDFARLLHPAKFEK